MIIIEGPDNSGKSSAIKFLENKAKDVLSNKGMFLDRSGVVFDRYVHIDSVKTYHAGGPAKTRKESYARAIEDLCKVRKFNLLDRSFIISSIIYDKALRDTEILGMKYFEKLLFKRRPVLVYCRPPEEVVLNLESHEKNKEKKEYDTEGHLASVSKNAKNILDAYDKFMDKRSNIVFDYTKNTYDKLWENIKQQAGLYYYE